MPNMIRTLKSHLVDSTAIMLITNPILAILEITICGMSNEVSIHSRIVATLMTYLGMGFIISKGRDFSRKLFRLTCNTKGLIQGLHDSFYLATINLILPPIVYFIAGSRDLGEIVSGTITTIIIGLISGAIIGYSIDIFRDLTNIKKSERKSYLNLIGQQDPTTKNG